jgi:DNA-directed RNA polymerase alpha subunit
MSEELSEMFRNWVRPEVVEVVIEESAVDPSRGTKVWESTNVAKYSETLSEWRNTKFEKIDPKAYLKRLQGQYGVTSGVEVDEEYSIFLDTALEDLDLTLRTYNALNRNGVHTLRQLIVLTENELLEIENLGSQGIEEIPKKIHELGLGFLLETPAWPFVQD